MSDIDKGAEGAEGDEAQELLPIGSQVRVIATSWSKILGKEGIVTSHYGHKMMVVTFGEGIEKESYSLTRGEVSLVYVPKINLIAEAEKKSAGLKFDTGKPPLELLSRQWLEGTANVLEYGKHKYAAHNWRKGIQFSRLLGAAMRHILAFQDGEDLDPETGLSHVHHASCCLMFISEIQDRLPQMDDRYDHREQVAQEKLAVNKETPIVDNHCFICNGKTYSNGICKNKWCKSNQ